MSDPNSTIQALERFTAVVTDLHRDLSLIKHDLQELRWDVRLNQATTVEQLKSLNSKFESLRTEIKEDVAESRDRQKEPMQDYGFFWGAGHSLRVWICSYASLLRLVLPFSAT